MTTAANPSASATTDATIDAQTLALRWAALGQAGAVVANMAGLTGEAPDERLRDFPALLSACDDWRQRLAQASCAELIAVMEPGLTTLLAVNAQGSDPRPAAQALWHEFVAARGAMLALLPEDEAQA